MLILKGPVKNLIYKLPLSANSPLNNNSYLGGIKILIKIQLTSKVPQE